MENVDFLVDYLTFSSKGFFEDDFLNDCSDEFIVMDESGVPSIDEEKRIRIFIREVLKIKELDSWMSANGGYGYSKCLTLGKMRVYYGGHVSSAVCVSMSGEGCRSFEDLSAWQWLDFLRLLVEKKELDYCNITRVDIACDEREGYLDLDTICEYTLADKYIKKFRTHSVTRSTDGTSIYFGSTQSNIRIRIYDKAAERGVDGHWIRTEIQLRDDMAFEMCRNILHFGSVGECFSGVLWNYLRFIEDSCNEQNCRADIAEWWSKYVGETQKIKLFRRAGIEYNLTSLEQYLIKQVMPSLYTYFECKGEKTLSLLRLLHGVEDRLNHKQKELIHTYKRLSDIDGFKQISNLEWCEKI